MRGLPWPLPALLAWCSGWLVFWLVTVVAAGPAVAGFGAAVLVSGVWAWWQERRWRQFMVLAGFPASALVLLTGAVAALPGWMWLLPLAVLLLLYPLQAWRDAPLFPTPEGALAALPELAPLAPGASILDAGCGTGAGLRALREAYPQAQLFGIERSWPLRLWCAWRCPWAQVRQGDIWAADWSGYDMVYLFQRPESMPRAAAQARAQLKPGAWLVSLEFEATELQAHAQLQTPRDKTLWVYRLKNSLHARSTNPLN